MFDHKLQSFNTSALRNTRKEGKVFHREIFFSEQKKFKTPVSIPTIYCVSIQQHAKFVRTTTTS